MNKFCGNCGQKARLVTVPPLLDAGLSQFEGIEETAYRLIEVFGEQFKDRLEVLSRDTLYDTYRVRYKRDA